jgi:aspartyl/glutamyl-tRNA(Asn/Gln) amidotransferase C subunit
MTDPVNIRALAQLVRLEVSDEEIATLESELPGILSFVETIQKADVSTETKGTGLHNVLRADENPHEGGLYTEKLLAAAPVRDGNRITVKQVVSRKPSQGGSADRK